MVSLSSLFLQETMCSFFLPEAIIRRPVNCTTESHRPQMKCTLIPINFDPDAVFGTNVASAFNDDWLNVYANFGWKTGRIDSALTVCLVCSDGHEFEFFYPLTSAEQVQLWNQMDAYCHQQNGQSLGETRTALLREQAEEGLEIRL